MTILSIPADHPSVATLERELINDVDIVEARRDMRMGCTAAGLKADEHTLLAVAQATGFQSMLLRRNADGALGELVVNDADEEEPGIGEAFHRNIPVGRRAEFEALYARWWAPHSEMADAGRVLAALLDDAVAIDEPGADVARRDAVRLEGALTAAENAVGDIEDAALRAQVEAFITGTRAALAATGTPS